MNVNIHTCFNPPTCRTRCVATAFFLALALAFGPNVQAQTLEVLHTFSQTYLPTNSDGTSPQGGLILSGNTLFGTTSGGGPGGYGTVFKINTDHSGFTNLYSFTGGTDGRNPTGNLLLWGDTLFGATTGGSTYNAGTLFSVSTNGGSFKLLHVFGGNSIDGGYPNGSLILSEGVLYGTTDGGTNGDGTVFGLYTNDLVLMNLHNFGPGEGIVTFCGLVLSGDTLYGTTAGGGSNSFGTVFAINTNGMALRFIHNFDKSDGSYPEDTSGLVLGGNILYGTTFYGGANGEGTVFAIDTDGTGFTNLYSFDFEDFEDGTDPAAGLMLSGNTLYGTTEYEGGDYGGTVFALNLDGSNYTNLYNFTGGYDGQNSVGSLVLSGNTLYGTTQYGAAGEGTVFGLTLGMAVPQLTIAAAGTNVILTWPTNATGFTLESTTNLNAPTAWSTVSFVPVVVNAQNTVTNPISSPQQFYRLSQ